MGNAKKSNEARVRGGSPQGGLTKRRGPQTARRAAKQRLQERMWTDTEEVRRGSLVSGLRKQGYEELPLEEIQDRLSKLRTSLAEFLITRRT